MSRIIPSFQFSSYREFAFLQNIVLRLFWSYQFKKRHFQQLLAVLILNKELIFKFWLSFSCNRNLNLNLIQKLNINSFDELMEFCKILNFQNFIQLMRQQKQMNSLHQEEQADIQLQQGNRQNSSAQVQRLKKVVIGLVIFIVIITGLVVYREFHNSNMIKSGNFYQNQILGYELDDFWKMTAKQIQQEQADTEKKILDSSQHAISRQQLGHNSWTLLHMVSGAFPQQLNDTLVKKFNAFLILFGQMYPCKLCANHFMQTLQNFGQFKGTTKLQLMTYLCDIHNVVNKRLGKPQHSCDNIIEEWNTCGCSGGR